MCSSILEVKRFKILVTLIGFALKRARIQKLLVISPQLFSKATAITSRVSEGVFFLSIMK